MLWLIMVVFLLLSNVHAEEASKTRLGISFAEHNVSCVNDFSIRLADSDFIYNISKKEMKKAVVFLPSFFLNYAGSRDGNHENRPESIMEIFRMALKKYFPRSGPDEFKFVSAAVKTSESDPAKIMVWNFTAARKSKLSKKTLEREDWKRTGLAFMGMTFNSKLEVTSAGYPLQFSDIEILRELAMSCQTIEELGEKVLIFPPQTINQEMRVICKENQEPMSIDDIYREALRHMHGKDSVDKLEDKFELLTAERLFIGKMLTETWFLTCFRN